MTDITKIAEACDIFARQHVHECAEEMVEWSATGLLRPNGRVRELAAICSRLDEAKALPIAEGYIKLAAFRALATRQEPAPAQVGMVERLVDLLKRSFRSAEDFTDVNYADEFDAIDRLAALASREAQAGPQWQPIETAPKDETVVDIWRPSWGGERLTNMRRVELSSDNVFYEPAPGESGPWCCVRDATHWMPLPAAPSPTATEGGEG